MHLKKWVRNSMMAGGVVFTALYLWWSAFNVRNIAMETIGFWAIFSAVMWIVLTALMIVLLITRGVAWLDDNDVGEELRVWYENNLMEADDDE